MTVLVGGSLLMVRLRSDQPLLALTLLVPVLGFWLLDAYLLLREHIYFRAPPDPALGAILGGIVPQARGPGMTKLREEDLVCAQVLTAQCGHSVRSAAQQLGVAESTLRYRLKRRAEGAEDGRRRKPEACAAHDGVILAWIQGQQERLQEGQRPAT